MQDRVTIFMHCTPPQYELSTNEVSSWYLKNLRQTDVRMDGDYFYIPRRLSARDNYHEIINNNNIIYNGIEIIIKLSLLLLLFIFHKQLPILKFFFH
jgi:hypothetical protein